MKARHSPITKLAVFTACVSLNVSIKCISVMVLIYMIFRLENGVSSFRNSFPADVRFAGAIPADFKVVPRLLEEVKIIVVSLKNFNIVNKILNKHC